jgi:hypothetical protein
MFNDKQLELISDAIDDYSVLLDEESADECSEIIDIIEAHFLKLKMSELESTAPDYGVGK